MRRIEVLQNRRLLAAHFGDNALNCDDVAALSLPDVAITRTFSRRANGDVPEHCVVRGTVEESIQFEVKLPAHEAWNGKFLMFGNGAFAGSFESDGLPGLRRGYATAATDTGHSAHNRDASWALDDEVAKENFAFRAVHLTAVNSKAMIRAFYDADILYSYFQGCSGGGRQGMMEAQRFPADFDGIIAGSPALDWVTETFNHVWNQQAMFPSPENITRPTLPNSKLRLLENEILAECDAGDGLEDGLVNDPLNCRFEATKHLPPCHEEGDSRCRTGFTQEEIQAVDRVFKGPSNSGGQIAPGLPPGGENAVWGWRLWITDATGTIGANLQRGPNWTFEISQEFLRYFVFDDPTWVIQDFDFEADVKTTVERTSFINANNPDLSAFYEAGGKLIVHHGWADHAINARTSIQYHDQVVEQLGEDAVHEFLRLFLLPGATHCAGGNGPHEVDWLTALETWVEMDVAPQRVVATGGQPIRERPICSFPSIAEWDGVGAPDTADSFVCLSPARGLLADIDGNGTVGFSDFLILSANFGQQEAEGDLDDDGEVGFGDFLILSESFGDSLQAKEVTGV